MQGLNLRSEIPNFVDGLMQLRNAIVHLHRQIGLLLQRGFRTFCARIDREMQRRSLRFAADGQLHLVIAGQGEGSFWSVAGIKCSGNLYWIIVAQIPCEPVHPFVSWNCLRALDPIRPFRWLLTLSFLFAGKMPDDFA